MKVIPYLIVIFLGLLLAQSVDILAPPKVNANPTNVEAIVLPKLDQFRLDLNLETGTSTILSNRSFDKTEVTVKHPVRVEEKVVVKPVIKERIVYETKVQVREKVVGFTLPTPTIHVPTPVLPTRVEL